MSLVSVAWLAAHAADADVRIVDFRWYLGGKRGIDEYLAGHVPGSVFVDLAEVTAAEGPGRHPIPSAAQLEEAMQRAGVNPGDHVVVVDDAGGSIAARLWWLLRVHGHARVSVLDGGLPAWARAGLALDTHVPAPLRGTFEASPRHEHRTVDKAGVATRSADTVLLDVRAPERYRGELEPVDARPGHIPGAINAPWSGNLAGDGTYATPETLRARYQALGATGNGPVIVSCGSGVTACHTLLAFDVAGLPAPLLYEGSYSDWARDPSLSVDTGDAVTSSAG